jgi:hypothetical protein
MKCPLCNPVKKTIWCHKDVDFLIIDCDTYHAPMIIVREHTMEPPPSVITRMTHKATELFGEDIAFRTRQIKILDHLQWYVKKT